MQLEPYLLFSGNCEEALSFYKSVLGGEIAGISRWKDMPKDAQGPPVTPENENKVMHARFEAGSIKLMAADASPEKSYGEGPISLSLATSDLAEAERVFDALSAGGKVEMPFSDMFWGAKFGMFTDKFGIDWMVSCHTGSS